MYCISDRANTPRQPALRLGQPVLASVSAGAGGEELAVLSPGGRRSADSLRRRFGHTARHSGLERTTGGAQQCQQSESGGQHIQ